jgi:hypothetical protein
MVLKERAKAAGSQPTGSGETPGGAQASMATSRRGVPVPRSVPAPEASAPHMVDHEWKDAQVVGSQPTGLGETPGGGVHRGAE